MSRIAIDFPEITILAELEDTPTAMALIEALPFSSRSMRWGEEVYFETPVSADLEENATDVVEPGTVCFWTEGRSLALPYGRTPASRGDECRLVAAVNLLGRLDGDPRALASVRAGDEVTVRMV